MVRSSGSLEDLAGASFAGQYESFLGVRGEEWALRALDDIHADLQRCGLSGSPTKVFRIQAIVLTKEGFTEIPATEEGVRGMIHELVVDRTLG